MDSGWTVHAEAAGDPGPPLDGIDAFLDALSDHGGAVTTTEDGSRYGATFSLHHLAEEAGATWAADQGAWIFEKAAREAGLPNWRICRLEVLTFAEHDSDLERPTMPELVGVTEIAGMLDVSRQRVTQLADRHDFPVPVARLAATPVWTRDSVRSFTETWARRTGRPPKEPAHESPNPRNDDSPTATTEA